MTSNKDKTTSKPVQKPTKTNDQSVYRKPSTGSFVYDSVRESNTVKDTMPPPPNPKKK